MFVAIVPDFIDVDADHEEGYFLVETLNLVLDVVCVVALEDLLVVGFGTEDEKVLENFGQ